MGETLYKQLVLIMLTALTLGGCSEPNEPSLALYLAVQRGDINQIERHIAWGSDINELNKDGLRPLHVASIRGQLVVVRLLLNNSADPNALDSTGLAPVTTALLHGRARIAELLKQKGADIDANKLLMQLVSHKASDRDVMSLLLIWGADINHTSQKGQAPLEVAITQSDLKMVKLLIRSGADVNAPNQNEQTPLELAQPTNDQDIIRILLKNGAQ